jgi:hypothetical protein
MNRSNKEIEATARSRVAKMVNATARWWMRQESDECGGEVVDATVGSQRRPSLPRRQPSFLSTNT